MKLTRRMFAALLAGLGVGRQTRITRPNPKPSPDIWCNKVFVPHPASDSWVYKRFMASNGKEEWRCIDYNPWNRQA